MANNKSRVLFLLDWLQENTDERQLMLRKGNTEYYQPLSSILFFETENKEIRAHTREDMFETPYKLYQLEELLPGDVVQLSVDGVTFTHTPVVVSAYRARRTSQVLLAAHSYDSDNRPLSTSEYQKLRCLHIVGVNKPEPPVR